MSTSTTPVPAEKNTDQSTVQNQYFICLGHRNDAIPWNPHADDVDEMHADYFGGVFRAMEKTLDREGLTIYLTFRLDQLPSYGPDVVAVVMDDELGRYPAYTNRVRAVFKTMGRDFPFEAAPFRTPFDLTAITAMKYVRTQMLRVPGILRERRDRRKGVSRYNGRPVPVYTVPVGYVNQEPLPVKPLADRKYDLFFSGSIVNQRFPWYSPQRWLRTPKEVARSSMVRALQQIKDQRPDLNVLIDTWDSFVPHETGTSPIEESYSEMMMNTRICPVPRGTRLESARLYEAMRYGCVLITEPLPDRWFLRGLPRVTVHDWADMPHVVDELLANPEYLETLHQGSLQWWNDKCSEAAVGQFMADKLNALTE